MRRTTISGAVSFERMRRMSELRRSGEIMSMQQRYIVLIDAGLTVSNEGWINHQAPTTKGFACPLGIRRRSLVGAAPSVLEKAAIGTLAL